MRNSVLIGWVDLCVGAKSILGLCLLCSIGIPIRAGTALEAAVVLDEAVDYAQDADSREIRFTLDKTVRANRTGALWVDMFVYTADDGTGVTSSTEEYTSADRATEYLQSLVKAATRVISRTLKSDSEGRTLGEKVVLRVRWNSQPVALLVWREGRQVHMIYSSSLDHVLAFEAQHYSDAAPVR